MVNTNVRATTSATPNTSAIPQTGSYSSTATIKRSVNASDDTDDAATQTCNNRRTITSLKLLEFKERIQKSKITSNNPTRKPDKQTRKLLLYMFTGTRGGLTRLKIILLLLDASYNTHQIAIALKFDYKAIQHHLRIMEKNNLVTKLSEKYGATYHVSAFLEYNIHTLGEVIDKIDRNLNAKKVYY